MSFIAMFAVCTVAGLITRGGVTGLCSTPYCPPPWHAFHDHCYLWVDLAMSWMDAERHCQMLSHPGKMVHLASIHSAEETEFINENAKEAFGDATVGFWIGYNDLEQENKFKWTDGSASSYEYWKGKEPNNSFGDEDCTSVDYYVLWNDRKCTNLLPFVCKM